MIKLLEIELQKLVIDGKVHPNFAREALDRLEASQSLEQSLTTAENAVSYQQGYEILRNAIKRILK
jgi:hypothetical protein